jgi:hypothetical protein
VQAERGICGPVPVYRYGRGEKEESPKWSGESSSPVSKSKEIRVTNITTSRPASNIQHKSAAVPID